MAAASPTSSTADAGPLADIVASKIETVRATTSSRARACRFCFDDAAPLIHPCRCRGSVALVHPACLQRWHETNPVGVCEICRTEYQRERVGLRSWREWRVPRPLADDPADEADFQMALCWSTFMMRVIYMTVVHGSNALGDLVEATLISPVLIRLWWISFTVNLIYYSQITVASSQERSLLQWDIMWNWVEENSIYHWLDRAYTERCATEPRQVCLLPPSTAMSQLNSTTTPKSQTGNPRTPTSTRTAKSR